MTRNRQCNLYRNQYSKLRMESDVDHYRVLGLPRGEEGAKLAEKEISKAYKLEALELHPDKRLEDPNAHTNFQKLKTSYEVLKDVKARKLFDDHMSNLSRPIVNLNVIRREGGWLVILKKRRGQLLHLIHLLNNEKRRRRLQESLRKRFNERAMHSNKGGVASKEPNLKKGWGQWHLEKKVVIVGLGLIKKKCLKFHGKKWAKYIQQRE